MFKKFALVTVAAVGAMTALPAAAEAQYRGGYYNPAPRAYGYAPPGYHRYQPGDRYYGRARNYNRNGYYARPGYGRPVYGNRGYYGRGQGYGYGYCRDRGNGGKILGAIAGGLLGSEVAGRGDRTTGAIIGGAAGAIAGRSIDRNC
jgi:hypothetical protein